MVDMKLHEGSLKLANKIQMDNQTDDQCAKLLKELKVARTEIHNLRNQIRSLKHSQDRDFESIQDKLKSWTCQSCSMQKKKLGQDEDKSISFKPIGTLSTMFPKKKGVPRQPGVCTSSRAKLTLSKEIFTNPEHSLEGLNGFSHMWILFHFDRNESKHLHTKVAPPRLNGEKTGVFATRSPHRPCPIGLSLAQIDFIEDSTIYFSGVDMLDGTPVFDIKPYIPQYDDPLQQGLEVLEDTLEVKELPIAPGSPGVCPGHREAPDGEESDEDSQTNPTLVHTLAQAVRVPSWVKPSPRINVVLSSEAEDQLKDIGKLDLWPVIQSVLREDPRSVYLKQRYNNQFYTFLISDLHVSCKFNDTIHSVNVYRVSLATKLCQCGQQEWQCLDHGDSKSGT